MVALAQNCFILLPIVLRSKNETYNSRKLQLENMSSTLADHESFMKHIHAMGAWIELENRLNKDNLQCQETHNVKNHWNNGFKRFITNQFFNSFALPS